MDDLTAAPPVLAHRSARIVYADNAADFRKMVWRGAALELITAGFYRFWLATNMRRHLWSHTSIEGDSLEYTGFAKELLFGFLFALAILVPIYLAYFLIGIEAERYKAFASAPLGLFFYLFFQFAIFRARRYRASRTIWRGVRFWMTGSGWLYAFRAGLWGLLSLITLGIAMPWREAALERYKMRHSHYGDLQGGFAGTGWGLFKKVWWLGALAYLFLGLLIAVPIVVAMLVKQNPAALNARSLNTAVFLTYGALLFSFPFIYAGYRALVWRWWISGIRFGEVRCESNLRTGALCGIYWAVLGWATLILFVDMIVAGGAFAAVVAAAGGSTLFNNNTALAAFLVSHSYVLTAAFIFNYLILALAIGTMMRIYLLRRMWARVTNSATVHNLEAADNVSAVGSTTNALGEGFANSLDIAGF
ncbi:MAG: DUF898 family protein [Rhizomicrobium sp.]